MAKSRYKGNIERLAGRSKAEIARLIKDQSVAGDQSRSFALGASDPRNRSGPDAAALTGQRYNPEQFWVDDDGRLNIRREAVKTLLLEEEERAGGGGGGTRVPFIWRLMTENPTPTVMDFTTLLRDFTLFNGTQRAIWWTPIPSNMDLTADSTVTVVLHNANALLVGTDVNSFDIELFSDEDGYVLNGSSTTTRTPDQTISVSHTYTNTVRYQVYLKSATATGGTAYNANTEALYMHMIGTGTNTRQNLRVTGAWLDYTTT